MSDPLIHNRYWIDRDDRIAWVDPAWDQFAISNAAPELEGVNVVGLSLWDFVEDEMTRHIYQQMLVEVRSGRTLIFDFRCDSPDRRRFLEMRITPNPNDSVQFATVTKVVEERSSQEIYRRSNQHGGEFVTTCSWCKKIKTAENSWHEVEQAIQILELFYLNPAPQLSHGMCEDCFDRMTAKIRN